MTYSQNRAVFGSLKLAVKFAYLGHTAFNYTVQARAAMVGANPNLTLYYTIGASPNLILYYTMMYRSLAKRQSCDFSNKDLGLKLFACANLASLNQPDGRLHRFLGQFLPNYWLVF